MKTKKWLKAGLVTGLAVALSACSSGSGKDSKTITVGATSAPHAIILNYVKDDLKKEGYTLKVKEFSDYTLINDATSDGTLDANYFQHQPYLDSYNKDKGYKKGKDGYLVSVGAIHYEPFGIYSKTLKNVSDVEEGSQVAIPNDATNEARALLLLQDNGLLTLKKGVGIKATIADIEENPKKLDFVEVDAAQTATKLDDVALAVVNGNYALDAKITDYLLTTEDPDSQAAKTYANVIAVKEENKDNAAVKALVKILKSEKVAKFIDKKFGISVRPAK